MNKRPNRGPPPPKELFALGTKTKPESDIKPSLGLKKTTVSAGSIASSSSNSLIVTSLKRERDNALPLGSGITQAIKRPRLGSNIVPSMGRQVDAPEPRALPGVHLFEDVAIDVEGSKLVESVMNSLGDTERIEGLLCGAVKNLRSNRLKPDSSVYLAVMFLAKSKPELFQDEVVIEAFCCLLRKETNPNLKVKVNCLVSILACNVFMAAMQDEDTWPDAFVKVYLDDSLGERVWVDRAECRSFVENVFTAFNTKLPKTNLFQVDSLPKSDAAGSAQEVEEPTVCLLKEFVSGPMKERYAYQLPSIEPYVMDVIRDQLSRRQPLDGGSKNLVRTLTVLCGFPEVRALVVQRLDLWLQSPKLTRVAQDLLMSVCMNCNPKSCPQDLELINNLCRIRFKTKPLSVHFNLCLKELLGEETENMSLLMQQVINNELSTVRNQTNMNFIAVMLQQSPEEGTKMFSDIVLELLMVREDHLKSLRQLVREVIRSCKPEFNFNVFIPSLLQDRSNSRFRDLDPMIKERYMVSVVDLVSMTMLLCVTSSIRELASNSARMEVKELELLRNFQNQMSLMQRETIWWLHSTVTKMMTIKSSDYMHCIRKVLFVEKPEFYTKVDNWPPESERALMVKLVSEVPLLEDMLLCFVLMGHNKELHLSIPELIDLLEVIVKRAASVSTKDFAMLKVDNVDFIGALLNLCAYRHPDNSVLPKGYKPPPLAITSFYWKAWLILLIISAFNPVSIGLKAWKSYPTLKCLMEMAMTSNFYFPPVTMASDEATAEEIKSQEKQMSEYFKEQTLEFECHLAGSQITETNSRLLPQVCRMEPEGFLLKPLQSVLDSVRLLNQSLYLGKLLCQSREPADFLLNIIQRQGASQSLPWLKDLVESNDSSLEVLPVQCLCEFLLHDIQDASDADSSDRRHQKNLKQEQLLARLQSLVRSPSDEPKVVELIAQTLSYFFERLSFHQSYSRRQATRCLSLILGRTGQENDATDEVDALRSYGWLFDGLASLSHFKSVKTQIFICLRAACQVETNVLAVSAYVVFLSRHSVDLHLQDLDDLVLDVAQLMLERVSLVSCLLPCEYDVASSDPRANLVLSSLVSLFHCHLSKAQQPTNETYSWSNNQYQILLHWSSGQSAKMNILIVHATVIVLAYGPPDGEGHYYELMEAWFPQTGQPPTAYLIDTSEEALLIPDWLKLRMIRSNVPRLIDASFSDAEVPQLLLFVQSFGISVQSMDKLLHLLDACVEGNRSELMRLVVDKSYMAELIEVQQMRGATGGEKFLKMLASGQKQFGRSDDVGSVDVFFDSKPTVKTEKNLKVEESNDEVSEMLTKIFLDDDASKTEKSNAIRSIQRTSSKLPGTIGLVSSLQRLLDSPKGSRLVEALFKNTTHSCSLFKVILSHSQREDVRDLCDEILSRSNNPSHGLSLMLRSSVEKFSFHSLPDEGSAPMTTQSGTKDFQLQVSRLNEEQTAAALKKVTECPTKMEEAVTTVLIPFIKQVERSAPVLESLHHLLNDTSNSLSSGLIIDCIEAFNPHIVLPQLLPQLLKNVFKRKRPQALEGSSEPKSTYEEDVEAEGEAEKQQSASESFYSQDEYLLCLLLHRSGWSNLVQVVSHILPTTSSGGLRQLQKMLLCCESCDQSRVLDFVDACFNVPNLWQGRDKKTPKHQVAEDILELDLGQIRCLVLMVMKEQTQLLNGNSSLDADGISRRLNLIENCCSRKTNKLKTVVDTLCQLQREPWEGADSEVVARLLWGMYLRAPRVFLRIPHSLRLTQQSMEMLFTDKSHVDIAAKRMIASLLDVKSTSLRQDEEKLLHASMVSRKLASQHPILFLRQLPLLSSLLDGHAQFVSSETKSRHLAPIFTNVIGIICLLQPYIFHSIHSSSFHSLIDSFSQIIGVQGLSARYMNGLVKKFIEIIFNYFCHDPAQAYLGLKKHLSLLRKLDRQCDDFRLLQRFILRLSCFQEADRKKNVKENKARPADAHHSKKNFVVAGMSGCHDSRDGMYNITFDSVKCLPPTLAIKPTPIWELNRFFILSQKTCRSYTTSTAELIDGLKELDEISRTHVDILEDFCDNIQKLMLDFNTDCRDTGYALMMRLMRYNPRSGKLFYVTVKKCLENENLQVVQAALESLKEFVVLAQEYAQELLVSVFKAGLAWTTDTTPYINETLHILNLNLTNH